MRRNRKPAVFQVFELFRSLECPIAHRRYDLDAGRQGTQRHLEAHLIVACGRASVRDHRRLERPRHLRDDLRLKDALRADAQRIHAAAAHIAHEQKLQHLLEIGGARFDEMMGDGAQFR